MNSSANNSAKADDDVYNEITLVECPGDHVIFSDRNGRLSTVYYTSDYTETSIILVELSRIHFSSLWRNSKHIEVKHGLPHRPDHAYLMSSHDRTLLIFTERWPRETDMKVVNGEIVEHDDSERKQCLAVCVDSGNVLAKMKAPAESLHIDKQSNEMWAPIKELGVALRYSWPNLEEIQHPMLFPGVERPMGITSSVDRVAVMEDAADIWTVHLYKRLGNNHLEQLVIVSQVMPCVGSYELDPKGWLFVKHLRSNLVTIVDENSDTVVEERKMFSLTDVDEYPFFRQDQSGKLYVIELESKGDCCSKIPVTFYSTDVLTDRLQKITKETASDYHVLNKTYNMADKYKYGAHLFPVDKRMKLIPISN